LRIRRHSRVLPACHALLIAVPPVVVREVCPGHPEH